MILNIAMGIFLAVFFLIIFLFMTMGCIVFANCIFDELKELKPKLKGNKNGNTNY